MGKQIIGTVSSNKANKSIVVTVSVSKTHPIYKKQYLDTKNFMAHDEKNEAQEGDKVLIGETRPISATKKFKLVKILERPVLKDTSDKKGESK